MAQAAIAGVGMAVPHRVLTNLDLERMVETSDEWIVTRTGIRERRIAPEEVSTVDLAEEAARKALAMAGLPPFQVEMIIVATSSPDYPLPATACLLQDRLGAPHAAAFDLQAACTGFIYGLSVGAQFIENGTYRNVLVVGAELLSRIVDWEDRATCVLFGDGAGAAVLRPSHRGYGLLSASLGAYGGGAELLYRPAGGARCPVNHNGFDPKETFVKMRGREVFKFAVRLMEEQTRRALAQARVSVEEVDLFVPHQANIRIIQALAERLGVPMEKVYTNIDRYGNTSAASIPIALTEAVERNRLRPGDLVAMAAFGAGLTVGAAVVRWGWEGPEEG